MNIERINLNLSNEQLKTASPGFSMVVMNEYGEKKEVSFGRLDDKESPYVDADTIYDVASITKIFTTALVLRQHELGSLSIHDDVSKYLPNFEKSRLTLVDLLSHRADFEVFLSEYRDQYPDQDSLMSALLAITPPEESSTGIHYGNVNFIYLGKILEKITGVTLDEQMRHLFEELQLRHTYTGIEIASGTTLVAATELIGDEKIQGIVHDETARILGGLAGNAGVFSSANDLVLFGKAWLDGAVVSRKTLEEAIGTNYDLSGETPQGLGWWLRYRSVSNEIIVSEEVPSSTGYTGSMLAINTVTRKVGALTCNRTFYGRANNDHRYLWAELIKEIEK